jgi:putative methionine-R-sulfoxide reductase with GAF domain
MTTRPAIVRRDYAPLLARLAAHGPRPVLTDAVAREAAMSKLITELWEAFKDQHLSWIGFYAKVDGADEMVLVCREPKPACSPIGLHGMCGRGWQERRSIVIQDVRTLGENYIACDPKDQSEVVVPVLNADGSCWGVLDADSYAVAGFDEADAAALGALIEGLGIGASVPGGSLRL